jgi:hypothetical protein
MNRPLLKAGRIGRRSLVRGAGLMILVAIFPQDAFGCIDVCLRTFGYYLDSGGTTYELESCSQRYNDAGGVTTTCYYGSPH